jgi:phage-related protein
MDKYIERSLKIVKGDIETDENSFKHAVKELSNRADELQNVFNEVRNKGLSMKDIDLELYNERNSILLTLALYVDYDEK